MKKLMLIFIIMLFVTASFAQEFDNYEWGKSQSELFQLLKERNKEIEILDLSRHNEVEIKYEDTIFNEPCEVILSVREEYGLYKVSTEWSYGVNSIDALKEKLLQILSEEYGKYIYEQMPESNFVYYWRSEKNIGIKMIVSENSMLEEGKSKSFLALIYINHEVTGELPE